MKDEKVWMMDKPLVYAVTGYKNSGKTWLMEKLVSRLTGEGYRVAVIKHDGHDFEPDVPGTDSYRHRKAGACGNAVFSGSRFMVTRTWPKEDRPADPFLAAEKLMEFFPDADIILVEGLKHASYPRYICRYPEEVPDQEAAYQEIIQLLGRSRQEN